MSRAYCHCGFVPAEDEHDCPWAAVLRYGNHEDECNVNQAWGSGEQECDCGFAVFTGELQASDECRANYEKRNS